MRSDRQLAGWKTSAMEFTVYVGIDCAEYPKWFVDFIEEGFISEEFGADIFYSENGEYAITHGDVFLWNGSDAYYLSCTEFLEQFYIVEE